MRADLSLAARSAVRSAAGWGLLFGGYVAISASGYASQFPTAVARARLARSFTRNPGLAALIGPARRLDTVAGFTAWRTMFFVLTVGAVWGLFLATRLLRGEEESGRAEFILAGPTTEQGTTARTLAGLGCGLAVMWSMIVLLTSLDPQGRRFGTSAIVYLATALVSGPVVFLAIGALLSQLAATRRLANTLGGVLIGASYLLRALADSGSGLEWLRWTTPFGWVEDLRPLTGSHPAAFVPIAVTTAMAATAAVVLARTRDLGTGLLTARNVAAPRLALLASPTGLALRLTRPVAIAWSAGLAIYGIVLGLVAQSASTAVSGSATIQRAINRLGGHHGGAEAYLGFAMVTSAGIVGVIAASQIGSIRHDEAEGYADNLLVRPVSRAGWLSGRLGAAAGLVLLASLATGVGTWVGAASQHTGVPFTRLMAAGINIAAPALLVLGAGALVLGLQPRRSSAAAYALVIWSFVVELLATVVTTNRWFLDTSLFRHITPVPDAPPNWLSIGLLAALGLLAAAGGVVAFNRRDLEVA